MMQCIKGTNWITGTLYPLLAHGAEFGWHFDYAWEFSLRRHYLG